MIRPESLVIEGGMVVTDASRPFPGDIIVSGNRIVDIVNPDAGPREAPSLDARGCFVLPGFIDAHVHGETLIFNSELSEIPLRQGITTYILGQDGCSSVPGTTATRQYMSQYFAAINGEFDDSQPMSVESFLNEIDRSAYLNAAFLVPHGNVRMDAMGLVDRPPSAIELRAMVMAVEHAIESGAIGISTGLDYIPSKYALVGEFNTLAPPVQAAGGVFVSHMRGYGERLPEGLSELATIAATSQVKIHASHLWGTTAEVTEGLARCEAAAVELSFDAYPYRRGSSLLSMVAVPSEMQEGGMVGTLSRLKSADSARQLADWLDPALPGRLALSYIASGDDQDLIGLTVEQAAVARGQSAAGLIRGLLIHSELKVGVVMARGNFVDADRDYICNHPQHMGSSDGIFIGERPHPRGWAAFTKLIELYLKDNPFDGWSKVASHLSARAADRFGLKNRGYIRQGCIADIAVLEPDKIKVNATYSNPKRLSGGVRHVLINGIPVIQNSIFRPSANATAIRLN